MTWIRTTIGAAALIVCGLSPLPANAALLLSADGSTVYDTVNNISWLADANLAASNRFGLPVCNDAANPKMCVNQYGSMSYQAAAAWVAAMNAANYLGHTNWQLPTTPSTDSCPFTGPNGNSFGFDCMASALGSLYYNALGLKAPNTAVPIPGSTTGPFSNFQPYLYWSQTGTNALGYATFSFNSGFHGSNTVPNYLYVLPMIQGKIAGTPPATGSKLQVNPGGQSVYDPAMNVTWLANANLAATNTFGLPPCKDQGTPKLCVNQDGAMNWNSADQFVTNMNAYNGTGYLGQTNWQLPPMDPNCDVSYDCVSTSDPFGELFYGQLGLSPGTPVVAAPDIAVGPFRHVQPYLYWACEGATTQAACQADGPATGFEWSFSFGNGFLGTDVLKNDFYVMAYYPGPPTASAALVVEYYNASLDHYFITWVSAEIAKLDDGSVIKGWKRTGQTFKTYVTAQPGTSAVCRYYIPPALGDSHFFGRGTTECNATGQKNPSFVLEDPAFMQMFLPVAGVCPANTTEVYRVFSNRPDANHRYMTDKAIRTQMVAKGWLAEGDGPDLVVMCAPQ